MRNRGNKRVHTPMGVGPALLRWVGNVNPDKQELDFIMDMSEA